MENSIGSLVLDRSHNYYYMTFGKKEVRIVHRVEIKSLIK